MKKLKILTAVLAAVTTMTASVISFAFDASLSGNADAIGFDATTGKINYVTLDLSDGATVSGDTTVLVKDAEGNIIAIDQAENLASVRVDPSKLESKNDGSGWSKVTVLHGGTGVDTADTTQKTFVFAVVGAKPGTEVAAQPSGLQALAQDTTVSDEKVDVSGGMSSMGSAFGGDKVTVDSKGEGGDEAYLPMMLPKITGLTADQAAQMSMAQGTGVFTDEITYVKAYGEEGANFEGNVVGDSTKFIVRGGTVDEETNTIVPTFRKFHKEGSLGDQ